MKFGIGPRVFFARLLKMITQQDNAPEIGTDARARIAHTCATRLCATRPKSDFSRNTEDGVYALETSVVKKVRHGELEKST